MIRIGTGLVEVGPQHIISTTTYNGQFPGPLLRFKEGRRVVMDIYNDTDTPEQFHWHGQFLPVDVDVAAEEGTPYIPAHGMRRQVFTPGPSGFRPVYIEPAVKPAVYGGYDREEFVVLKEFDPYFMRGGDIMGWLLI